MSFNLKDFPHMILNDRDRTKCPALIHECRTYNTFYQIIFNVQRLGRSHDSNLGGLNISVAPCQYYLNLLTYIFY